MPLLQRQKSKDISQQQLVIKLTLECTYFKKTYNYQHCLILIPFPLQKRSPGRRIYSFQQFLTGHNLTAEFKKLTSLSISHFESTIIADSKRVSLRNLSPNRQLRGKAKHRDIITGGGRQENILPAVHLGCLILEFGHPALNMYASCYINNMISLCTIYQNVPKISTLSTKHCPGYTPITNVRLVKLE